MAECSSGRILVHHAACEKSHSKVPLVSRSRDLVVPPIALDRESSRSLRDQVSRQIAQAIRSGALDGARLPSTRALARLLGISRNTVMTAYEDLVASGLVRGRRGSGMLVAVTGAGGVLDMRRVLRQAHYPARTLRVVDPDGTDVYLSFR
jgi:GntR family transcriptional regulator/MocR family aminotransferase